MTPPLDIREAAAAYALGALDSDERVAFERLLVSSPELRAEVDAYCDVAGLVALSVARVTPPNADALRERILAQASQSHRITGAAREDNAFAAAPDDAIPSGAGGRRVGHVRSPWGSRVPWLAAAASITIALATGAGLVASREAQDRLSRDLELARRDATGIREQLARRDSALMAFMGPMVHVVSLAPSDQAQPTARVYWNHTARVFVVTAFNVPPAPQGKTYQLWAIRKGKAPLSMGTFNTDPSGRATSVLPVGAIADAGFIDNCALTLEPAGGSPQPTETPRLLGSWRHVD